MKAAYLDKPGGPEVLTYGDLPDPTPGPGQVLIRVHAISLNHVETVWRSGIRPYFKITPPHVLGGECAGEVIALGPGATGIEVGARVCTGTAAGSYAELAVVAATAVALIPDSMSFEQAAAFGSTGPTAFRAVVRRADVRPGQNVLVTAAASGTGLFIVQIARAAGAFVIGTAGGDRKRRLVEESGAHATIDHYSEDIAARIAAITDGVGIDSAIDPVSSQTMFDAITTSLKPRGKLVTYGNIASPEVTLNIRTLFSKGLDILGAQGTDPVFGPAERREDTRAVLALGAIGTVKTVIDSVLPLAEARRGHEMLDKHEVAGKVILTP
jgi:NADPH2:quinone reductase